jgi:hypothetical protein
LLEHLDFVLDEPHRDVARVGILGHGALHRFGGTLGCIHGGASSLASGDTKTLHADLKPKRLQRKPGKTGALFHDRRQWMLGEHGIAFEDWEGYTVQMNVPSREPRRKEPNPMADSWKPKDKAAEAAFENPAEFDVNHPAIEDSRGPIPSSLPKTHSEVQKPGE